MKIFDGASFPFWHEVGQFIDNKKFIIEEIDLNFMAAADSASQKNNYLMFQDQSQKYDSTLSKPKTSLLKDDSPFDTNQKYDSILSKQKKSEIKIEEEPQEDGGLPNHEKDRVSGQQILKPKIHNIEIECQDIFNKNSTAGDYNNTETTKGVYKDDKFVKSRQSSMRMR